MNRGRQWFRQWGSFLAGVCIGLLIVAPVLAAPIDTEQLSDQVLESLLMLASVAILLVLLILVSIATTARPRTLERRAISRDERIGRVNG
jgi:hypothetical protein